MYIRLISYKIRMGWNERTRMKASKFLVIRLYLG